MGCRASSRSGYNMRDFSSCVLPGVLADETNESESSQLDFEECALYVGAEVVLIGELVRDSLGALAIQPLSCKKSHSQTAQSSSSLAEISCYAGKVLVSDAPQAFS